MYRVAHYLNLIRIYCSDITVKYIYLTFLKKKHKAVANIIDAKTGEFRRRQYIINGKVHIKNTILRSKF